jgi:hypothetical protein
MEKVLLLLKSLSVFTVKAGQLPKMVEINHPLCSTKITILNLSIYKKYK